MTDINLNSISKLIPLFKMGEIELNHTSQNVNRKVYIKNGQLRSSCYKDTIEDIKTAVLSSPSQCLQPQIPCCSVMKWMI